MIKMSQLSLLEKLEMEMENGTFWNDADLQNPAFGRLSESEVRRIREAAEADFWATEKKYPSEIGHSTPPPKSLMNGQADDIRNEFEDDDGWPFRRINWDESSPSTSVAPETSWNDEGYRTDSRAGERRRMRSRSRRSRSQAPRAKHERHTSSSNAHSRGRISRRDAFYSSRTPIGSSDRLLRSQSRPRRSPSVVILDDDDSPGRNVAPAISHSTSRPRNPTKMNRNRSQSRGRSQQRQQRMGGRSKSNGRRLRSPSACYSELRDDGGSRIDRSKNCTRQSVSRRSRSRISKRGRSCSRAMMGETMIKLSSLMPLRLFDFGVVLLDRLVGQEEEKAKQMAEYQHRYYGKDYLVCQKCAQPVRQGSRFQYEHIAKYHFRMLLPAWRCWDCADYDDQGECYDYLRQNSGHFNRPHGLPMHLRRVQCTIGEQMEHMRELRSYYFDLSMV